MTVTGQSCQQNMSLPAMFWTSIFLLSLATAVYCSEEQLRLDSDTALQPSLAEIQQMPMYHLFLEYMQRQYLQQPRTSQEVLPYNGNNDLTQAEIDWRKWPMPLAYQMRALTEGAKEKGGKRRHLHVCYFKVCNYG